MIDTAILLNAGQGSRLLPLTADRPKCLIEIGGSAIVDHQLDALVAAGIPRRGFDLDHYDVPAAKWAELVALGAHPVGVREFVQRLAASGLRVPQRDRH